MAARLLVARSLRRGQCAGSRGLRDPDQGRSLHHLEAGIDHIRGGGRWPLLRRRVAVHHRYRHDFFCRNRDACVTGYGAPRWILRARVVRDIACHYWPWRARDDQLGLVLPGQLHFDCRSVLPAHRARGTRPHTGR